MSASQTTVGEYCPTPEPTDPRNYDDGSNDPGGNVGVTVTATYPPTAIIGGTGYPFPTGSTIVVGGSTLTAPTGTSPVTTTVGGGTVVTLLPSSTGLSISVTQPGITPVPTTAPTPPWTTPGPGNPTNPNPTWDAVWIEFRWQYATNPESPIGALGTEWVWFEWPHQGGGDLQLCSTYPTYEYRVDDVGLGNEGWPPSMTSSEAMYGRTGCRYIGNDNGAGQMECNNVARFDCIEDQDANQQFDCTENEPSLFVTFVPKVRCIFPDTAGSQARVLAVSGEVSNVNGTTDQEVQVNWPGYRAADALLIES